MTVRLVLAQFGTTNPRVPLSLSVATMSGTVVVIVVRERSASLALTLPVGTAAFVEAKLPATLPTRANSVSTLFVVRTFVSVGLVLAQLRSTRPRVPLSMPIATLFLTLVVLVMREVRTRSAVTHPVSSATLRVSALVVARVLGTVLASSTMTIRGALSANVTMADARRALTVRIAVLTVWSSASRFSARVALPCHLATVRPCNAVPISMTWFVTTV